MGFNPKVSIGYYYFYTPLTYNDERVVNVHAAKPVSSLTDVSPRVLSLHLFDTQSVL